MALDSGTISTIAKLARLNISQEDSAKTLDQLNTILELVDQLQAVDTDNVTPMAHPMDAKQRLRSDVVTENDQRDHFQQQAPAVEDGLYLVPKVID